MYGHWIILDLDNRLYGGKFRVSELDAKIPPDISLSFCLPQTMKTRHRSFDFFYFIEAKEDLVTMAKLSEQAERYDDMMKQMKQLAQLQEPLSSEVCIAHAVFELRIQPRSKKCDFQFVCFSW